MGKMTINEFIDSINKSTNDKIQGIVECVINDFSTVADYTSLTTQIENITPEDFTGFGDKISECIHICKKKLTNIQGLGDNSYKDKLDSFLTFLYDLDALIRSEGNARKEKQRKSAENAADKSYVVLQNLEVVKEQLEKINKVQESADAALEQVKNIRTELDSKIFSLLINTVAILGIFVAIAFAGLGITSLFSDLDFATAFASKENFIRTVFFLFLVALLSYNLLLLMVYFVFKLSRPILGGLGEKSSDKQDNNKSQRFTDNISLTPFYWVNGIMLFIIIVLFLWGISTYSSDNNVSPDENSYVNSETISGETDTDSETIDGEETT